MNKQSAARGVVNTVATVLLFVAVGWKLLLYPALASTTEGGTLRNRVSYTLQWDLPAMLILSAVCGTGTAAIRFVKALGYLCALLTALAIAVEAHFSAAFRYTSRHDLFLIGDRVFEFSPVIVPALSAALAIYASKLFNGAPEHRETEPRDAGSALPSRPRDVASGGKPSS
jgi:hypothetical protein